MSVSVAVEHPDADIFLDAKQVRRRYGGRSEMALYLGFPAPIYIQQYRYWRLADLLAWERNRPTNRNTGEKVNA